MQPLKFITVRENNIWPDSPRRKREPLQLSLLEHRTHTREMKRCAQDHKVEEEGRVARCPALDSQVCSTHLVGWGSPLLRQGMRTTIPRRVRNKNQTAKRCFMADSSVLNSRNVSKKVRHK